MNIFFTSPDHIYDSHLELVGQEAAHVSKVLRYRQGDRIAVTDGQGGWYEGTVGPITNRSVQVELVRTEFKPRKELRLVLGLGIIKKRGRLEFAIEKAVELGVSAIALFKSEHTVKEKVRLDRIEAIALSAMKQSMQAWLPEIKVYASLDEIIEDHPRCALLAAHEKAAGRAGVKESVGQQKELLLLVGPEGGFSDREIDLVRAKNGQLISLGNNRLRTETAAVVFLSQFI